jgi:ADP-heptose:LPS heptosyltransferase
MWRDRLFYVSAGIWNSASFQYFEIPANGQLKEAQSRLRRLSALGIPPPPSDEYRVEIPSKIEDHVLDWLAGQRRLPHRPLIAVCPGAKTRACIWPAKNFLELGRRLLAEGTELLLLGGPEHGPDAEILLSSWGSGINGIGKFSVWETASALKHCDFLIGVDTGTTHLAAAVGTRCLAIFSQREISCRWEPMGDGHEIIRHPVPCQGCGLAVCNMPGHPCMTGTTVDVVFEKARQLISEAEEVRTTAATSVRSWTAGK